MTRNCVRRHMIGEKIYGCTARWYPQHCSLDVDDWEESRVEDLRAEIGLNDRNSMLFEGERADHWRILFAPTYKGKPPTIALLQKALQKVAEKFGIEVYPHSRRISRLPFSKPYTPMDLDRWLLDSPGLLREFQRLNEYDITNDCPIPSEIASQGLLIVDDGKNKGSWYKEGRELFETGLIEPHSRNTAQAKVIYFLYRSNVPREITIQVVREWIKKKHNGCSEDFPARAKQVYREIDAQIRRIYEDYGYTEYYPDSTHNGFNGWITKPDLVDILRITGGNLPRTRFVTELIKYSNPRQVRPYIRIHTDHLQKWSSERNYNRFISELSSKRILERKTGRTGYLTNSYSKAVTFNNWPFRQMDQAIMSGERSPDNYEETIQAVFTGREYRTLLEGVGVSRTTAIEQTRKVFEGTLLAYW